MLRLFWFIISFQQQWNSLSPSEYELSKSFLILYLSPSLTKNPHPLFNFFFLPLVQKTANIICWRFFQQVYETCGFDNT